MATPRLTHVQREECVLTDLETHFPQFAGQKLLWNAVPEGKDPPDFISHGNSGPIGLELVEWLDGDQMTAGKRRESLRNQIVRLLATNWENEYRPQNFRGAFIEARDERIACADGAGLQREFFACAAAVDGTWLTNAERFGGSYYQTEFLGYPLLGKYFSAIRYIGGDPHGHRWMDVEGDGGAFDPAQTVETLRRALDAKLTKYLTPEKQTHLKAHGLSELCLLVHAGFNAFAYLCHALRHCPSSELCGRGRWWLRSRYHVGACASALFAERYSNTSYITTRSATIRAKTIGSCFLRRPRQEGTWEQCGVENDWAAC